MISVNQLLLMRHAKSDRANWVGPDHERPLNDRGVRSARAVGRYLSTNGRVPDLIISSTAVRAHTTADLVVASAGWESSVELDERLYGAGPMEVIGVIREVDDAVGRLLLVGHQPTWSMVVSGLTGGQYVEMPTAAVAVIDFDAAWRALGWDGGRLVDHVLARGLLEA